MTIDDDHTPTYGNQTLDASQEVDGFDLYADGATFLANLGIPAQEVEALPQILMTTIGSLLKQVDGYIHEIDDLNKDMRHAVKLVKRLRAQRDALRAAFQQAGIDPRTVDGSGATPPAAKRAAEGGSADGYQA